MYTNPDVHDKVDVKGLQLVRRDSCALVKEVSTDILNKIMFERSVDMAVEVARAAIARVLRNEEPMEKFIMSKALRSDYKNPNSLPHAVVASKLLKRTGVIVPSGKRVPFVYAQNTDNPTGPSAQRAEDPEHVRDNNMQLDTLYYLENLLAPPIESLLKVVLDNPIQEVFGHESIKARLDALRGETKTLANVAKRKRKNEAAHQPEITTFFKPK